MKSKEAKKSSQSSIGLAYSEVEKVVLRKEGFEGWMVKNKYKGDNEDNCQKLVHDFNCSGFVRITYVFFLSPTP